MIEALETLARNIDLVQAAPIAVEPRQPAPLPSFEDFMAAEKASLEDVGRLFIPEMTETFLKVAAMRYRRSTAELAWWRDLKDQADDYTRGDARVLALVVRAAAMAGVAL